VLINIRKFWGIIIKEILIGAKMKIFTTFLFIIFSLNLVHAGSFTIDNVSQQEIDALTEELGADWVFTTVSSAKATGDLIPMVGVEVGIVAGVTKAPKWAQLIKEEDPSTDIDKLPYLNFIGTVSFRPIGLTIELGIIPEKSSDGASIKNTAIGAKWTFLDNVLYSVAARVHYNSNELSFIDTVNVAGANTVGSTSFDTNTYGAQLIIGADLLGTIEPYAGLGFVKSSTDTNLSANVTITDITLTGSRAIKSSHSSAHIVAGVVFDLFIVNLGVEYMNALGTSRIAGKFSINL
jgi:hypothetical protein